jgi:FkbM family methyltransferase
MVRWLVSKVGSLIQGTPLEEPIDRAYYEVTGPRRTELTLGGVTARFNARSSSEYHSVRDLGGEASVVESAIEHLSTDDVVWDIGAFVGWHAALFGQVAETVAFEADPDTFAQLQETCTLNPDTQVTPVCLGLGNPPTVRDSVSIAAGEGGEITETGSRKATTIASPATLIDSILRPPTAVKIDVQGHEGKVIEGFGDYLTEVNLLFIEFHEGRMVGDWTSAALHEYITRQGFDEKRKLSRRNDTLKLYSRS